MLKDIKRFNARKEIGTSSPKLRTLLLCKDNQGHPQVPFLPRALLTQAHCGKLQDYD